MTICRVASVANLPTMPIPIHTTTTENAPSVQAATQASTQSNQTQSTGPEQSKTEAELAAEKRYEEAIEEEYAKREGGA
ncbi:uncharacterized protein BDZ99DRAFT_566238 [Mytilinidion resinicola]|uniref:Uncharacterized protein n=1 Tax=Mytilinidion resinicola TaxID=574789 RepID=A0A6A6Z6W0_9PEZI|nr:uncharacterized protein BDZ99DRAFT_566238 [Mytilinidion resinicola]KAF2816403.1 hypothetical protein BDZ99DRAFT_566238 [Mytilinidion resinicola]